MGIDTYDYYCGHTSMSNIVEVGELINRLTQLIVNTSLRRRMGEAGQARAREVFEWSVIIKQYSALWDELEKIRNGNKDETLSKPNIWPERLDPMIGFKQYPSAKLMIDDKLELGRASGLLLHDLMNNHMITYAKHVVPTPDDVTRAIKRLGKSSFTAKELALELAPASLALGMRHVATLTKFDVVRLSKKDT
jgi:hypothetical protein